MSQDYKNEQDESEIYTPSFDHNNEPDFRKQSPSVSSTKMRAYSFKRHEEVPYMGHIMLNNDGKQVLQPLYPAGLRGSSLPPPMAVGRQCNEVDANEEVKENMAALPYYPT